MRSQFQEVDLLIKKVQATMREHRYIIKTNSSLFDNQNQSQKQQILEELIEKDAYTEANKQLLSFDSMCQMMPRELEKVNGWAQDQVILLQSFLQDREKLVKVNLKCNQLAQENSKLKIETDKQKLINQKYRNSLVLRTDQSPQSRALNTQRSTRSRLSELGDADE